jgi:hypothetical protein
MRDAHHHQGPRHFADSKRVSAASLTQRRPGLPQQVSQASELRLQTRLRQKLLNAITGIG